jgi:hypothetical protein
VTVGDSRPAADDVTARKAVAEFERQGFISGDKVQLRFSFEASGLREAVDLSAALRAGARLSVQIRPASWRLLTGRRWTVMATTPPAPLLYAVVRLWEEQLDDVAREHHGCRVIGWKPIMQRGRAPR